MPWVQDESLSRDKPASEQTRAEPHEQSAHDRVSSKFCETLIGLGKPAGHRLDPACATHVLDVASLRAQTPVAQLAPVALQTLTVVVVGTGVLVASVAAVQPAPDATCTLDRR
jgi:hypothetical protein